jgi:lipid-A-disaccharide synthase
VKTLFLVAGEISGDTHGAALIEALRKEGDWFCTGLGGPAMREQATELDDWLDQAAVLGLWEVLRKYGYFQKKMDETVARIHTMKPDGVVLIDYPGFNLRLATRLRREGYAGKLIYYISPQVWAWKKGRIKTMARLLDLMICIFPFEQALYEKSGLRAIFAGHPLVDTMAEARGTGVTREEHLVALLPGSREREIEALFPAMLEAACLLRQGDDRLRFLTTGATPTLTDKLRRLVAEAGLADVFSVGEESSHRIMQRATVGAVASGTATLEAACLGLPYCLVYRVAWLTALVARNVLKIEFLGMVNVLAKRFVVREILQEQVTGESIASELRGLLVNREAREFLQKDLASVVGQLGDGGAHRRAALAVAAAWEEPA